MPTETRDQVYTSMRSDEVEALRRKIAAERQAHATEKAELQGEVRKLERQVRRLKKLLGRPAAASASADEVGPRRLRRAS